MQLPTDVIINNIKDWKVLYFKDRDFPQTAPPHYHLIIPTQENTYLVVCLITSKIQEKRNYFSYCGEDINIVEVSKKDISCLNKISCAVCPNAELMPRETLIDKIEDLNIEKTKNAVISEEIKKKIILHIKKSSIVDEYTKSVL